MPVRNILTLGLAIGICLASYSIAVRNRYASIFSEAMHIVDSEALVQIPKRELFNSAMDGMLGRLDTNSFFISADEFAAYEEDLNQEFIGVGMHFVIDPEHDCLRVVSPLPGKPAWKAGIQVGDLIVGIDGTSTAGIDSDTAVARIRGPLGSAVVFSVLREPDAEAFDVRVIREEIPIASVLGDTPNPDGSWNYVLEDHPQIGYIRLLEFGRKSTDEMRSALQSINGQVEALILDLRDNPGGLLDAAVDISDMFVGREVLVVETRRRDGTPTDQKFAKSKTEIDVHLPLVVLVNQNSASASEIVAACLQDYDRAVIVGQQTYGKGTVQDLIQLEPNRSVLRLTTASYWRPSGKNIDRTVLELPEPGQYGVSPNDGFHVEMSDAEAMELRRQRHLRDTRGFSSPGGPETPVTDQWLDTDRPLQKAIEYLVPLIENHSAAQPRALPRRG